MAIRSLLRNIGRPVRGIKRPKVGRTRPTRRVAGGVNFEPRSGLRRTASKRKGLVGRIKRATSIRR